MNTVERIKSICKERKIPISSLEKNCGFSNGYIGQLKKGTIPDDRLQKISAFLNLSIEYLMTGTTVDVYSEDFSHLYAKIRKDVELSRALVKYFDMSEEKKKHVINTINMFFEG